MRESTRLETTLGKIESRLQRLIEGNLTRLIPGNHAEPDLAHLLVQAMWNNTQVEPDNSLLAPNLYLIEANPEQAGFLAEHQAVLDELAFILSSSAQEAGLVIAGEPAIRVVPARQLASGDVRVMARHSQVSLAQTNAMELAARPDTQFQPEIISDKLLAGAFLIVDGTRIFSLTQPLINIGRRPDNDLVIDDARVSRMHAQLRVIQGRFVIFDLDSKGGTQVNGQSVHQHTLTVGDVISLSGVPLVYGQEDARPDATQRFNPLADSSTRKSL